MERLALSWGNGARQFTKLLLSLLSHIGEMACRAEARGLDGEARLRTSCYGVAAFARHCVASEGWWVATVLPRALRFKRPLHRCNACNPSATRRWS